MNKLYGCVVSRPDHYERIEGGGFNAQEFTEHPEKYISTFSLKVCVDSG
jgi:alpha-aminoadipic semialdehyde synthase